MVFSLFWFVHRCCKPFSTVESFGNFPSKGANVKSLLYQPALAETWRGKWQRRQWEASALSKGRRVSRVGSEVFQVTGAFPWVWASSRLWDVTSGSIDGGWWEITPLPSSAELRAWTKYKSFKNRILVVSLIIVFSKFLCLAPRTPSLPRRQPVWQFKGST